jgi:predicted negative regulator of RcsB-dependent stress response
MSFKKREGAMSKNKLIAVLILAVAGLGGWMYLQDKGANEEAGGGKRFIAIGTGGPTGVYFATRPDWAG